MKKPENYLSIPAFYQEKRDLFRKLLEGSRFELLPCQGSYFQLLSYAGLTDQNDRDFAVRLTREIGVASIPVSVFYSTLSDFKLLRFCFAKEDAMLQEAAGRLRSFDC
jgi:methionine aminotransferase